MINYANSLLNSEPNFPDKRIETNYIKNILK